MAAVFLGEPIRPIQVVGGAIILAGVALLRRGSWPSGRTSPAAGDRRPLASVIGAATARRRPSRRCSPANRRWPSSSTTTGRSR